MRNPVMTASGTFGYGPEYAELVDFSRLGAIVVKGISREPVRGNATPRTVEVASGLINAIGLQNPGVDGFVKEYMPFLRRHDVPVIVNIWGRTIEDYAFVAERFDAVDGVAGLEVNVSCPNIKEGSCTFGSNLDMFKRVIAAVRAKTKLPLIPKLIARGMPLLAICRGFQEVNVALGGSLHQAVQEVPGLADHRARGEDPAEVQYGPAHPVHLVPGGLIAATLGGADDITVNSVHGQGVNRLAAGLRVEARAPDGLVEAFSIGPAAFQLAVQWHPEWQAAANPVSMALLRAFGAACQDYRDLHRPPSR